MNLELSSGTPAGVILDECIRNYEKVIGNVDRDARDGVEGEKRAYGGLVRSRKGKLVEHIAKNILHAAWLAMGKNIELMEFNLRSKYEIPIRQEYINKIPDDDLREEILNNGDKYKIKHGTDIHVYINKKFILSIECKAYAENAMLKRILFDAFLLQTIFPNLKFALVQLESQMGGDYSNLNQKKTFGSPQSHTLMSYMDSVNMNIITLLEGERKVKQPIHNKQFYKPLRREHLESATNDLARLLNVPD